MAEIDDMRVAILASGDRESGGGGSTADRVARDSLEDRVAYNVGVVVCNNAPGSVGVYERFEQINTDYGLRDDDRIEVVNISGITHPGGKQKRGQTLEESEAICRLFEERGIDFAFMLGYLKILTGELEQTWGWQPKYAEDPNFYFRDGLYHPRSLISNNHPQILPFTADTHGHHAHQQGVDLRRADRIRHGAMTWQLASAEVDKGPIIHEKPFPIEAGDDADAVSDKAQVIEKKYTAEVLEEHLILRIEHQRANT